MRKSYERINRLEQLVHREIAQMIHSEMKDPRLGLITVSNVSITKDLSYAKVFVTIWGPQEETSKNVRLLNQASGYFRTELSKRLKIRKIPEISFHFDKSLSEGYRISNLIERAISEDESLSTDRFDGSDEAQT